MTLDALLVLAVLTVGFLALLITCYGLVLAAVAVLPRIDAHDRALAGGGLLVILLIALVWAGSGAIHP